MPLQGSPKARGTFKAQTDWAKPPGAGAELQALRENLAARKHESGEVRRSVRELWIARMKHTILAAEIKLACLEGAELCARAGLAPKASRALPCGLPIQ
jgi:hypothetical protein